MGFFRKIAEIVKGAKEARAIKNGEDAAETIAGDITKATPQAARKLTEEDRVLGNFTSRLESSKWNNSLTKEDYNQVEAILSEKRLLQKARQINRPIDKDYKSIINRIKNEEPISIEELNHLKGSNPRAGILSKTDVPIPANMGWGSTILSRINVVGHGWHGLTNPIRWGEYGTAARRLLGTTALVAAPLVGSSYYNQSDLEGLTVNQRFYLGLVRQPLDHFFDSKLETYSGKEKTSFISDQEFDRLTAESGFRGNAALTSRTQGIFGESKGNELLENIRDAQIGTVEYWRSIINVATQLKAVEGQYSNQEIMYAYKHALASTLGMPGGQEIKTEDIVEYAKGQYVNTAVSIFTNPNRSPEEEALRRRTFEDFTGNKLPEKNSDINTSLLGAYADNTGSRSSDPLTRLIVKNYLLRTTSWTEEDLAEDKVRETYKSLVESTANQQRTENFRNMIQGNGVTAPQRSSTEQNVTPDINKIMDTLTRDDSFGMLGKKEVLISAWNKAMSPDGKINVDQLDDNLKKGQIHLSGRQVVESWAMQLGASN